MAKQYPASMTLDEIKRACPAFGPRACPFAKLPEEKKGAATKCPAFKEGCPFKGCKCIGDFEGKLGEMRDQCKGDAAYVLFLRAVVGTAMQKEVDLGKECPFFKTKGGCAFATDTKGKPIVVPDYVMTPYGVTMGDIMFKCPAFGKGMCPYAGLVEKGKGLATNCPAFKAGCPFKACKTVGEFVEKLSQMRDHSKGKENYTKFLSMVMASNDEEEKKIGKCPFNAHACPFSCDPQGKPILPK